MASPALKQFVGIWNRHGDRIVIGSLVLLLVLGVMFAIQRKSADPADIVNRIAQSTRTTAAGQQGPQFDADKVLKDIGAHEPTTPYIEISSKNVFYTPQQWSSLKKRLEDGYKQGLSHNQAANPSGWKAALAEFENILILDPEQRGMDYNQGKPADLAESCKSNLKTDELNSDLLRAQQEWDRARDFETKGDPVAGARTYERAVELYKKIVEQGKALLAADRITESQNRADEGTRKVNQLLGTHLTKDVRDKIQQMDARLSGATVELPVLKELFNTVNELQKTLDEDSQYIEDTVEQTAKARIEAGRQKIANTIPGLYAQAQAQLQAVKDPQAAQQIVDRLVDMQTLEPQLPGIDELIKKTQTAIADAARANAITAINGELDQLKAGYDELMKLKGQEDYERLDSRRREILQNKDKFLGLARDIRNNQLGSQLVSQYTRVEQIPIPKRADFLEIVDFPARSGGDRVRLKNNRTGATSLPLAAGGRWSDGGFNIQIDQIDSANGTVKVRVPGFAPTTLTIKK